MHSTQSLFDFLGFQVQSVRNGVYRLHNPASDQMTYIALLYSPEVVAPPQAALQVFMLEVPQSAADAAQAQWGNLDARRLGESGILPIDIQWGPIENGAIQPVTYPRDDGRARHGVRLFSGDVVCYN